MANTITVKIVSSISISRSCLLGRFFIDLTPDFDYLYFCSNDLPAYSTYQYTTRFYHRYRSPRSIDCHPALPLAGALGMPSILGDLRSNRRLPDRAK